MRTKVVQHITLAAVEFEPIKTMKCQFCDQEKNLIEAHIIPAGFYRRLKAGRDPLTLYTNRSGKFPKRVPIGIYDKTILCGDCERIWGDWDNYAQQLLDNEPLNAQVRYHRDGQKLGYVIDNFDYKKLKLFFISMIWRASVSNQQLFSRISLDSLESVAKEMIREGDPETSEDF